MSKTVTVNVIWRWLKNWLIKYCIVLLSTSAV